MAADNQTTIAGNLVDTPELRFTNTGTPVTNLRVAVTQRVQDNGSWRDDDTVLQGCRIATWAGSWPSRTNHTQEAAGRPAQRRTR